MARWNLFVGGRRVYMTDHAIARWRQRVRPHLESDDAVFADARRLVVAVGAYEPEAPHWVNGNWEAERTETEPRGWLVLGDICMPLAEDRMKRDRLVALTVLTRGGISDEARVHRNRQRSRRTHAKRKRGRLEQNLMRLDRPKPRSPELDA